MSSAATSSRPQRPTKPSVTCRPVTGRSLGHIWRIPPVAQDPRAALHGHAGGVLADPARPILTTSLVRAETAGHNPRHLLAEAAAARREPDTADRPAEALDRRTTVQPNR